MENEKQLTEQESLQIIHEMINAAKNNIKADTFVLLLWGWVAFIASIGEFFAKLLSIKNAGLIWWVLIPLALIITITYVLEKRKKEKTRTHISEFIKLVWIAFTTVFVILIFFCPMTYRQMMPVIMALYGMGLFLSGYTIKFKPLIIGGVFCWICSIPTFYIQNIFILLIIAASVLGGYIIPGYLLKFNKKYA